MNETRSSRVRNTLYGLLPLALVLWVGWIGWHRWWRPVLLTGLAAATFLVGTLVGFIFTTYDQEASTIGKIKDWLVASLATLTFVEFRSIRNVLILFALTSSAGDYALTVSVAIVFWSLGFLFMFFGRELIFNVPLALARSQRNRIENTEFAGVVTLALLAAIPPSLLAGTDDPDEIQSDPETLKELKAKLLGDDVKKFLGQSDDAVKAGAPLDWDVTSKVAYLQYYRAYFAEDDDAATQQKLALEWIERALFLNPHHVDFTAKRAQVLAWLERYRETVSILDLLYQRPDCPAYVEQWLGFYLLYLQGREDDAVRCNLAYLKRFPDLKEARRNLASAYAQKVCREPRAAGAGLNHASADYLAALANVRQIVEENPDYVSVMQTAWIGSKGSFACFAHDEEYLAAVGLNETTPKILGKPSPAMTARSGA
jgi:tetratricopeptide (TPR) repeat protein